MGFLIILLLIFVVYVGISYNKLQGLAQSVRREHSNIQVSMKKRVDLANKLQDIAAAYGDHEKLTHISIAAAEANIRQLATSAQAVDHAVSHVVSMARDYPELRANQTYQILMGQLTTLEENLQDRRETYNATVHHYNTTRSKIPVVFFASTVGFNQAPYFDVENADDLENIRDFASDDGAMLKAALSGASRRVVDSSRQLGQSIGETGKQLGEAGKRYLDNQRQTDDPNVPTREHDMP